MASFDFPTWVGQTWRRTAITVAATVAVAVAGVAWRGYLADSGRTRVREGRPTPALVTGVNTIWWGRNGDLKEAVVTYEVDGTQYHAGLSGYGGLAKGEVVTLYVDPKDATEGATEDGLLTEGRWVLVPDLMTWIGFIVAGLALTGRVVMVFRRRGPADTGRAHRPPDRG